MKYDDHHLNNPKLIWKFFILSEIQRWLIQESAYSNWLVYFCGKPLLPKLYGALTLAMD